MTRCVPYLATGQKKFAGVAAVEKMFDMKSDSGGVRRTTPEAYCC